MSEHATVQDNQGEDTQTSDSSSEDNEETDQMYISEGEESSDTADERPADQHFVEDGDVEVITFGGGLVDDYESSNNENNNTFPNYGDMHIVGEVPAGTATQESHKHQLYQQLVQKFKEISDVYQKLQEFP